ncbi:MAG: leucyl aminopeptidase, partial [Gammaproteobacteria bacterium]
MKYSTTTSTLAEARTDCLIAGFGQSKRVASQQGAGRFFNAATTDFEDEAGKTLLVSLGTSSPIRRMLVVGGLKGTISAGDFNKAVKSAAKALSAAKAKSALWALNGVGVKGKDPYWKTMTSIGALNDTFYSFDAYRSAPATPATLKTVALHADARSRANVARAVRHGQAARAGLDWARDLGNQPPNICNPNFLLKEARKLSRKPNVSVSALDEKKMTELGMGAFMAVTQGSSEPGKMIIIRYNGAKKASDAPVVLIGKGITFDTGGISIKPSANMHEMKWDMCGAATVMGTTRAAIEARLPINLITIVAAAENMPSGKATRPGDIVTTSSGKTVEILNTDAEGRLVLCDAITYAARFKPKAVVDVATLTGACIVALGSHATAVYANDDDLGNALIDAGEYSGDRGWRMPLWEEYQPSLKSQFADMANIGTGGAGSVTAACFLSRFADDMSWAHLDIAGTA